MAVAARVAQCAFVLVILLVTGNTGHGRVLEKRTLVTGIALNDRMLAAQREAGLSVIEARLVPGALDVTVTTFIAQRALVLVVLFVTGHAGCL